MRQWSDGSSEVEIMGKLFFFLKGVKNVHDREKAAMRTFIPYIICLFLGRMGVVPPVPVDKIDRFLRGS